MVPGPAPEVAFDLTPMQNAHRNRGIGRYVGGLARRLAAQTDVPIEFWGWDGERPLRVEGPHSAIWLPRYGMPRSRLPWVFAKVGTALHARRSQARVVHVTDPRGLLLLRGRQVLTTVYDLIPVLDAKNQSLSWGYQYYLRQLRRLPLVFAISTQTAQDLSDRLGIERSRIVIAKPGVDLVATPLSVGVAPPPPKDDVVSPGTRAVAPYFLYLGSPDPHKNLPVLLEAMARAADLPETLVIAGTWYPENLRWLRREADRLGLGRRVQYRGFVPDGELAGLIAAATALVVPSKREGFGLPVAEGFAANGVVIHSRIPVLAEVSAGAALEFDPDSSEDLAACLRRVSDQPDERARLRALGQRRRAAISWDAAVAATLDVYRDVLGRD